MLSPMLLTFGNVSQIPADTKWFAMEFRSEHTIETTMKRLAREVPAIFRDHALQCFLPIEQQNLNVFDLQTLSMAFVRSDDFVCLLRLKQVTGIMGLATKGDTGRSCDVMPLDDSYVTPLIEAAKVRWDLCICDRG